MLFKLLYMRHLICLISVYQFQVGLLCSSELCILRQKNRCDGKPVIFLMLCLILEYCRALLERFLCCLAALILFGYVMTLQRQNDFRGENDFGIDPLLSTTCPASSELAIIHCAVSKSLRPH